MPKFEIRIPVYIHEVSVDERSFPPPPPRQVNVMVEVEASNGVEALCQLHEALQALIKIP